MPPPPIRPPMWNNQPQIPGTDLPPMPPSGNAFQPPPPPGTSVSNFYMNIFNLQNVDTHEKLFPLKNHRIGLPHCHQRRHNNSHGVTVLALYRHYQLYPLHLHHRRAVKYIRQHNIIALIMKGNFQKRKCNKSVHSMKCMH